MGRKIKNLKDLRAEQTRLKLELTVAEETLKEDLKWVREEMRPARIAGNLLNKALGNKQHGLIKDGVRVTVDTVVKDLLLAKSGWITRLVVPWVVKNLSSNYLADKSPEIFSVLRKLIKKARKSTGNHAPGHFDKSTVDEMDY